MDFSNGIRWESAIKSWHLVGAGELWLYITCFNLFVAASAASAGWHVKTASAAEQVIDTER